MARFKEFSWAVLVLVAVIVIFTIFGVHRSLGAQAAAVEDQFYDGVKYDGYTHKSINSQLSNRTDAALGLISIASKYGLEDGVSSLRDARNELLEAKGISEKSALNRQLDSAFNALYSALTAEDLSDSDMNAALDYNSTFTGSQKVIDESGYNEAVRKFNREVMSVFPINFLKHISFVSSPELFE